jgi:ribonuclease D
MGRKKYSNRDTSRRNKGNKGKSNLERKLLLNYLQEYQERSFSLYYSTTATSSSSSSSSSSYQRQDDDNNNINRQQPIKIGGVCLPRLDNDTIIIEQPFLALPRELAPYQRAMVHDICVENLKLFHCGVDGENEGERCVVVSIYSDGFSHVPGLNDTIIDNKSCYLPIEEVGKYKPWIMLKDSNSMNRISLKTNEGEKLIRRMIDQPGRCFRDDDNVDTIDLIEMENDDLSTILPPTKQDDDDDGNPIQVCLRVDTVESMQRCIKELEENKPTEIGFDLESYNKSKNYQITCLIQLATNDGREYIIDVLGDNGKVWDTVGGLANVFADKSIVKIGHGINGLDIQSLQRDFGIFVVNVFDTYEAAVVLELKEKGLATICAHYGLSNCEFYNTLKRTYQKTNWAKRPLTEPMILYGRYDVHYLIQLRKLMIRDLIKAEVVNIAMDEEFLERKVTSKQPESSMTLSSVLGDEIIRILNEEDGITENDATNDNAADHVGTDGSKMQLAPNEVEIIDCIGKTKKTIFYAKELRMNLRLMEAISKSQYHCLNFWNMKPELYLKNKKFLLLATRCKMDGKEWSKSQLDLYAKLVSWREDVAKKEESLPGVICSLDFLVMVALLDRPTTEFGLRRIRYDIPYILVKYDDKRYMKTMLELVKNSRTEDGIEICEQYPTYKDFKERNTYDRMQKYLSLQENSSSSDMIANWVRWTVTSAAISIVIYVSISKIKGKR